MAVRPVGRRVPRVLRIALWSVGALLGLVVIAGGAFLATFDANSLKPRIIEAARRETGRDLTLQGPIRLKLSLQPTISVDGAALSNPPGFSRPQMATLDRLDLTLALLPLLRDRIEIRSLVLVHPDILLETDANARPNWEFIREAPVTPNPEPAASAAGPQEKPRTGISVADVRIENATLAFRDGRTGGVVTLGVKHLDANAADPDAKLHLSGEATYNATRFTLDGDVGPLTRLQDPAADSPWPVQLTVGAAGARLVVDGMLTRPLQGRGYAMKLTGEVPDLRALSPLMPGRQLPPLRDVTVSVQLADSGGRLPGISDVTLRVGKSDLSGIVAGLLLDKLEVVAARFDQPMTTTAQGSFNDVPLALSGSLGAPANLLLAAAPAVPYPFDLNLQAAGSNLAVKGSIKGAMAGTAAGGRLLLRASVASERIDLDAVLAALRKRAATPVAAPAASGAAPAAPPPPARNGRLFTDTPIPFALLRLADADLAIDVQQVASGGAVYRNLVSHLVLWDGRLRVDPFGVDLPEGRINGALTADAMQPEPAVTLHLNAPALAVQPLLAALGQPAYGTGNAEVYADLQGAGTTPHAIAASLDGSLGLAMAGGTVDNRLLGGTLGTILREVNMLDLVGRGGASQIRCFATRLEAKRGIGTVRTLLLSSSLLTMDGEGSVDLGAETLDLRVRPQARVAVNTIVVPLRVRGSLQSPSVSPDPTAAIFANAGTVAGALGSTTPLGMVAGALVGQKLLGGTEGCDTALALARGQAVAAAAAGQAAAQAPAGQPTSPPAKLPDPGALLRQLFR